MKIGILGLVLAAGVAFSVVRAEEGLRERAEAAWAGREDPSQAMLAVELYSQMAAADPADVEARLRLAEAAYWVIEQDEALVEIHGRGGMSNDQKATLAEKGAEACRQILKKDLHHVGANYWLMYNMASRTMARGIFSGFAFRESIVGTIMVAKGNVAYHYGGVYSYWGAVIYYIPDLLGKFFHFTKEDSVFLYQQALAVEPRYLRTHVWLAECYAKMGKKDLARQEYEFCVNQPDGALPEADIENRLYKQLARVRLEKM